MKQYGIDPFAAPEGFPVGTVCICDGEAIKIVEHVSRQKPTEDGTEVLIVDMHAVVRSIARPDREFKACYHELRELSALERIALEAE